LPQVQPHGGSPTRVGPAVAVARDARRRARILGPRGPGPPGMPGVPGASGRPIGYFSQRRATGIAGGAGSCDVEVALPKILHAPFGHKVPPMPEDFLGREVDVWSVLQHLSTRRAVVVCGRHEEQHGVGKSAVLDAVHRAFVFQTGGVCVAVHLRSLSDPEIAKDGAFFWIEKVKTAVRAAFQNCQEQWCATTRTTTSRMGGGSSDGMGFGGVLRRRTIGLRSAAPRVSSRTISRGFHPLSDPIAVGPALEELVTEMAALTGLCEAHCREWPAASGQILLLLDECDHLIQQQHFQETVADVLQRCTAVRVVLSTHQRMVGMAGGCFKVVHHPVAGLPDRDAARLFLRRVQRPLRWGELVDGSEGARSALGSTMAKAATDNIEGKVIMNKANEAEVLALVAAHPCVATQKGNPRRLIELASRVGPNLGSLGELGYTSAASTKHSGWRGAQVARPPAATASSPAACMPRPLADAAAGAGASLPLPLAQTP